MEREPFFQFPTPRSTDIPLQVRRNFLPRIEPSVLSGCDPDLPRLFQPIITEDFRIAANSFGVR
jgi:hypothetical protein